MKGAKKKFEIVNTMVRTTSYDILFPDDNWHYQWSKNHSWAIDLETHAQRIAQWIDDPSLHHPEYFISERAVDYTRVGITLDEDEEIVGEAILWKRYSSKNGSRTELKELITHD